MTDAELKALVAENSAAIREMRLEREASERLWQESRQESERKWEESERKWQESRQESERRRQEFERWWQESRKESERRRQEFEHWMQKSRQETERIWLEIRASRQEFDRLLTSFNRQLGQIGNRLGDYTESLFRPSLERVLREQFGMKMVTTSLRVNFQGEVHEFDMVAHSRDESDEVYLVEIKSKVRDDSLQQLVDQLRRFPRLFPEHRGKKLYGILAALDVSAEQKTKVLREGFYLATIKDDVFEIVAPGDDFEPRAFGFRGVN